MSTFSADQVVGKTLYARYGIPLKRLPSDDAPTVYTVAAGDAVGRVYSWTGGTGGKPLWWMFYDDKERTYYAKHESGAFDTEALRDQGALDVKEQQEAEKEKSAGSGGLFGDVEKTLKTGIIVILGAVAASFLIRR